MVARNSRCDRRCRNRDIGGRHPARLARLADLIAIGGLAGLPGHAVKHLEGRLWELRLMGRDGIARAIYVTASGQRVVIVNAENTAPGN